MPAHERYRCALYAQIFERRSYYDQFGVIQTPYMIFWGTFGASNQLLAALALIGVTVWLKATNKRPGMWLVAFIPAVFMYIMSMWALGIAVYNGWVLKTGHAAIPYVSCVLIVLALLVALETVIVMASGKKTAAKA